MSLELSERTQNGCTVVEVRGELDLDTAPSLRERLHAIQTRRPPLCLIIDMSGLTFMNSTGLGVLLGAQQRAARLGGSIALAGPQGAVARVLHLTGFGGHFAIYPTAAAAATASQAGTADGQQHPRPNTMTDG